MMVLRKLAVALLSVGVMLPGLGHALAVGDLQTKSALGEPFWGEVDISETADLNADEIKVALASQEDFDRVGVERVYFLTDLRFQVILNPAGRSYIKITSIKPVREPYLDFVVKVAWPGNASLRELTALLDPPVDSAAAPADVNQAVASAPVASPVEPVPAPVVEPVAAPVAAEVPPAPAPVLRPSAQASAAPKKSAPVAASPVPAPDSYRTQSGDTMSRIAQQFRPADASSAQTMVAIQRANPSAFSGGNINQLKRGQVLRIPSESEIREVSASEAVASVRQQSEEWRASVAASKPAPLEAQQVDATAPETVKPAPAPVEPKPEMKLLGAQAGKSGAAAAGKEQGLTGKPGDVKKLDENKAKVETAKVEKDKLANKVSTLDAQVKANDKQLDVQNAKLAELEATLKAEQAKKEAAAAAGTPVAETPAGVETQTAEAAAPVEAQPLPPTPAPAAKPAPVVAEEEAPADEASSLPLIGGGLAALLAVLGGGYWWNQKRKKEQAEEAAALAELEAMDGADFADQDFPADGGLFDSTGSAVAASKDSFDSGLFGGAGAAEPAADADVFNDRVLADPLEEVEQYLAYERYPQAVGFLNKAISATPDRADLRLKLLEVYAKLDDWNGFTEQEAWFENAGDLNALAHAEELKAGMTPPARRPSSDEPLNFERVAPAAGVAAAAAVAADDDLPSLEDLEMDFNATVSASSPALRAVKDSDLDLPDLDADFSLDTPDLDMSPVQAAAPAADSGLSLDEDLDFSFDSTEAPAPAELAASDELSFELDDAAFDAPALADQPADAPAELDFSLDDGFDNGFEPAAESAAVAGSSSGLGELVDFDSTPEVSAVDPATAVPEDELSFALDDLEPAPAQVAELDGDFSLDDGLSSASDLSFDQVAPADSGLNDMAADFDATLRAEPAPEADVFADMTFDEAPASSQTASFDTSAFDAPAAAPAASADADLGMDDEFDFLADTDENATKLDLARAYIDMGDMDGARDILHEVLSEGNLTQKDEAKGLLAQVG